MATTNFFDQLEDFIPKHVSPIKSYVHALAAFVVTGLITYFLGGKYLVSDFNQDDNVSETEVRARRYVQVASSVLISLLVADSVYAFSFRVRGFKANKKHFVWKRWFPKLY